MSGLPVVASRPAQNRVGRLTGRRSPGREKDVRTCSSLANQEESSILIAPLLVYARPTPDAFLASPSARPAKPASPPRRLADSADRSPHERHHRPAGEHPEEV